MHGIWTRTVSYDQLYLFIIYYYGFLKLGVQWDMGGDFFKWIKKRVGGFWSFHNNILPTERWAIANLASLGHQWH